MKKLRLIMYLFTVCAFLTACSGDDGDPGPAGKAVLRAPRVIKVTMAVKVTQVIKAIKEKTARMQQAGISN
ncbi:MAG TPA: hypothetical protein VIT44_15655 [Cyclobacteriaceae bacterium]